MIAAYPDISIYEPGQKAILAWNGREEVMILSTDVKASNNTKALEIVPFYSKPEIEQGDFKSFSALEGIFMNRAPRYESAGGSGLKIVSHERIGQHDVTTIFVKFSESQVIRSYKEREKAYADEFRQFAVPYLNEVGMSSITFPDNLGKILDHYDSTDGFYCVLDVIDIDIKEKSVTPLVYRFRTNELYYPLVISQLTGGETSIQLYLIMEGAPDVLSSEGRYAIQPFELGYYETGGYIMDSMIVELYEEDLKDIDVRVADLFSGSKEQVYATAVRYTGNTEELTNDLKLERVLRFFTL
jgi:hypothetical protein